jgi:PAS domain S-box-containing protein
MALPPRVSRYIRTVCITAVGSVIAMVAIGPGGWRVSALPQLLVLLALTTASEYFGTDIRHRGQAETLTMYEAVVVVNIAFLPAGQAATISLLGLVIALLLKRRELIKTVFNTSMYAVALGPAIVLHDLMAGSSALASRGVLTGGELAGLAVAAAIFAFLNLILISQLLALFEERTAWEVIAESGLISVLTLLGNAAVGLITVVVWAREPAVLPAVLLVVFSLHLAYRASGRQMDERERFQHLYGIGQALSSSLVLTDVLPDVLPRIASLFRAEEARLFYAGEPGLPLGARFGTDGFAFGSASDEDQAAVALAAGGFEPVLAQVGSAPEGWAEVMVAPLVASGRPQGVLVIGNRRRPAGIGRRDLAILSPLASGLASSLSNTAQVNEVQEEKSKLEQIVGLSSDGILLVNGSGLIQLWNTAMERITGVPAAEAVGAPYDSLLAGTDSGGTRQTLERLLIGSGPENPRVSGELHLNTREGQQRWLRCNHSLLYEGGSWTTDVVIVHDVTRMRQTEKLKADFVATVSHELRTPITPIKGYVELLRGKGARLPEDKRQEMLGVIAERADHMARLIEDLLLASRISSGAPGTAIPGLRAERIDLGEVAERAAADYLRDPRCRLRVDGAGEPLPVEADPMRLTQILSNLLSNAHKYSPADRPVLLRIHREDDRVLASVIDRGRGIPREELDRVFDKFHRVEDPMTMTTGGTGLGLFIARELARAMNGDIEVSSVLHQGSTFTLALPLATGAAATAAPAGAGQGRPGFPDSMRRLADVTVIRPWA